MPQHDQKLSAGMRISPQVLEDVCKKMIRVILYALPDAIRGTIYTVGPIPQLRVVRVASGSRTKEFGEIVWDAGTRSVYDPPGKVWEDYRDRPDAPLEAMAWCVERQKSWTADDPARDIRSARKRLVGAAGEDYHHMEPVLVFKPELWDTLPDAALYPANSDGEHIWAESKYATVAVVKIHFLAGAIRRGDRATKVIKELCYSLGTEMLSLHAREVTLDKERKFIRDREETCNVLAHEFRNLMSRVGFAYRAVNNEISCLREAWERLVHEQFPEQPDKKAILGELSGVLRDTVAACRGSISHDLMTDLERHQQELMESCLLPAQNEAWLAQKIRPLWQEILRPCGLSSARSEKIEELLGLLKNSFHVGLNRRLRERLPNIPEEVKERWVTLAYQRIESENNGHIDQCIDLLADECVDFPRKSTSRKNLIALKHIVALIPEIEKRLNHRLTDLKKP
jgi:hypothetical protein